MDLNVMPGHGDQQQVYLPFHLLLLARYAVSHLYSQINSAHPILMRPTIGTLAGIRAMDIDRCTRGDR